MGSRPLETLAVLDFEATCAEGDEGGRWDPGLQEIIEVPVSLVSLATRRVEHRFTSFVRPTHQPLLTPFCTRLTSIQQADVDAAETIEEVMRRLEAWFERHRCTPDNTLVVTCGDWDLETMWTKQVGLLQDLPTPPLFRSWCNLKVVFAECAQRKATGMMGMLGALDIPHEGHHHRGADDVANLSRLVIELLGREAHFRSTWTEADREAARARWERKQSEVVALAAKKAQALDALPAHVNDDVRQQLRAALATHEREAATYGAMARRFVWV